MDTTTGTLESAITRVLEDAAHAMSAGDARRARKLAQSALSGLRVLRVMNARRDAAQEPAYDSGRVVG
jgi:hypothetical protein